MTPPSSQSVSDVFFEDIRTSILIPRCLSCHSGPTPSGDYSVASYVETIAQGRVIPGSPTTSLLIARIKDGSMPPGGGLLASDLSLIEAWILQGAREFADEVSDLRAPFVNAGADQSAALPLTSYTLTGTAQDVDGWVQTIQWTQASGPSVTMMGQNTLNLVLTNISVGVYEFILTVMDNDGLVSSDRVQLTILPETTTPSPGNPDATYTWIVANVLNRCTSCHGSRGGVNYESYANTVRTVRAGDASRSTFYREINSGSMPEGSSKLPQRSIDAVRDWINAGALNN